MTALGHLRSLSLAHVLTCRRAQGNSTPRQEVRSCIEQRTRSYELKPTQFAVKEMKGCRMFIEYSARFINKTYVQFPQSWSPIRERWLNLQNSLSQDLQNVQVHLFFQTATVKGDFKQEDHRHPCYRCLVNIVVGLGEEHTSLPYSKGEIAENVSYRTTSRDI